MAERGFKYDELTEADDAAVEHSRPHLHAAPCGHGIWVSALDGTVYEGHGGNEREQWSLHQRGPWVRLTDEDFLSSAHREALARAEHRATRAEAERDEWREVALQERGAALDALEQIKARDARIKAVRDVHRKWTVGDPCDKRRGCGGADCAPHINGHGDKVWRHWRDDCTGCAATWPCPTIRALDGTVTPPRA